jgi:hypothetical protein
MREALRAHLLADAGLAALVGTRVSWPWRQRGDALPSVTLRRIDAVRDYTMGGPSGLVRSRVQVDCWAATYDSATVVSRAAVAALSGMRETVSDIDFQGAFADDERDLTDEGSGADEVLHRVSVDFLIWHSESE